MPFQRVLLALRPQPYDRDHPGSANVPRGPRTPSSVGASSDTSSQSLSSEEGASLLRLMRASADPAASHVRARHMAAQIERTISLHDARNVSAEAAHAWSHVRDTYAPSKRKDAFFLLVAKQHPSAAALDRPAICDTLRRLRTPR